MRHFKQRIVTFLAAVLFIVPYFFHAGTALAQGGDEDPKTLVKMQAKIFTDDHKNHYFGLYFKNKEGWHTYWKNPGDAGTPLKHTFKQEDKVLDFAPLEWMAPTRYLESGNLQAYGYHDLYGFFFSIPAAEFKRLQGKKITIFSQWLICQHICIPGQRDIQGTLKGEQFMATAESATADFEVGLDEEKKLFASIPAQVAFPAANLELALVRSDDGKNLNLFYSFKGSTLGQVNSVRNLITPFPDPLLTFQKEQLVEDGPGHRVLGKLDIEWDGAFAEGGPYPLPVDGIFKRPVSIKFLLSNPLNNKVEVVEKSFERMVIGKDPLKTSFLAIKGSEQRTLSQAGTTMDSPGQDEALAKKKGSFLLALFFAFLGGIILNFMPCVLPVISLKLFGLIKISKRSPRDIAKHNLFYTLGILTSFSVLGLTIILLKAGGEEVGWGFHLQSPYFVGAMILFLFVLALNLFGLFEFQTPGGKFLGETKAKSGFWGDFFSGVISTILSTPCSAPFLGTALTFAFTSPPQFIILTFLMVGLGLSFPFILTGLFPKMVTVLPAPGHWMEDLKRFLALALLLTLVWLMDVFQGLAPNGEASLWLNISLVLLFFAFYFKKHIGKRWHWQGLFFLLFFAFASMMFVTLGQKSKADSLVGEADKSGKLDWRPWSEESLEAHAKGKEVVFMDFTAKWCFTCKVNEKFVLDSSDFAALVEKHHVKLLLADWTRKDPPITQWLRKQNVFGVPAYFIQDKEGQIHPLGETISVGGISEKLEELEKGPK